MKVLRTTWWLQAQLAAVVTVALLGVLAALTVQPVRPGGSDVLTLVGSASSAAADTGSYRMQMRFVLDAAGIDVSVEGSAAVDTVTGDSTGELTLPGGGELSFVATGGRGYFELPEQSPMRLRGKSWVSFPLPTERPLTEDPLVFLQLIAADARVEDLGADEVRGVRTTHYRARIDPAGIQKLAQRQQSGTVLTPQTLQLIEGGSADVWLSDDGLPRRVAVALVADRLDMELSFDLFDFGAAVRAVPPPADEVIEAPDQQEAQGFLSGMR